jgi:hypothetical protein
MGVGDLLDETFRLYRQHFGVFLALGALFVLPPFLVNLLVRLAMPGGAASGLQIAVSLVASLFLYPVMTQPSAEAALGRAPSVGDGLRHLFGRLGSVALATLVYVGAPTLMVMTLVGIPFGVYFFIAWSLVYQALLLEERGALDALGRSRQLVRGSWWRVFGIGLIMGLLTLGIVLVLSLPTALAQGLDQLLDPSLAEQPTGAGIVLEELTGSVAQLLANPIGVIGWTLLYYDLRMRKEGLDLELRAQELSGAPPPAG